MPFSTVAAPYSPSLLRGSYGNLLAIPSGQTALTTGDYLIIGSSATSAAGNKGTIIFNNNGWGTVSNAGATSNGDKLIFYNDAGIKVGITLGANADMYFQANGNTASGFFFYSSNTGTPSLVFSISRTGLITTTSATLLATSVALTNGAGASAGTLTNAPAVGNPTKWIPISDNGTTRYIPAW